MIDYGLVSIITPLYNCEKYIGKTIESVQNQTYQNWEMLVVDDCSSDKSCEIVESYVGNDCRVKLLHNPQNSGAAVSRNYALREARGKWIAFLDSDDIWVPEKLQKQLLFMNSNDYAFSYTATSEMDESGKSLNKHERGPKIVTRMMLYTFNYMGTLTVMYNRDKIGLIQIEDLKRRNDYAMWLKVIKKSQCYFLDEELSVYRVRKSGSLSNGKGRKIQMIKDHYLLFRKGEKMNPLVSGALTMVNIVFYFYKKVRYKY